MRRDPLLMGAATRLAIAIGLSALLWLGFYLVAG
jgi:hypothetical protein